MSSCIGADQGMHAVLGWQLSSTCLQNLHILLQHMQVSDAAALQLQILLSAVNQSGEDTRYNNVDICSSSKNSSKYFRASGIRVDNNLTQQQQQEREKSVPDPQVLKQERYNLSSEDHS